MSFEDLRCDLRHHWIDNQKIYPTERQRIQLFFMLLLCVYTTSRPGAILQTECVNGINQACDTATLSLCCSQTQCRADETCGL